MSVKIVYSDIAVGAADDTTVSASGQGEMAMISLLPHGADETKYVTLGLNRWILDASLQVYDGSPVGFWSDAISKADCRFDDNPSITLSLGQNYTSVGIGFTFDEIDYVSELDIVWYQGETQLDSATFYPDAQTYFCIRNVIAYNKVVITFKKTNLPHRRVKLNRIDYGVVRTFTRDELRKVNIIQEIDPTSQELAINTLDWTLDSKKTIEYIFQLKQPVKAYDGETLLGVFYIEDSSRASERVYSVSCKDAIGVLDDTMFQDGVYSGKNAMELAQEIAGSDFEIEMDAALQGKTVTGIITNCTRRQALQQLCFAIGGVADTSGTDKIKIFSIQTQMPTEIGEDRTRVGGSVTTDPIVTAVKLTAHSYKTSGSGDSVTVNGKTYYDTKTVTTINNPNVTATDKQNDITIENATLISGANVQEIAQIVFDYAMRRNHHNFKFRIVDEQTGDYVSTITNWGQIITGNLVRMSIVLSGIAVADAEVR